MNEVMESAFLFLGKKIIMCKEKMKESEWMETEKRTVMLDKVSTYVEQNHMLENCKTLILGVSGGADSVCLFRMMQKITRDKGIKIVVVHIEHGIRGKESLEDAKFVENLCKNYAVPFYQFSYEVEQLAKDRKESTEETGRKLRYDAFEQVAKKYEKAKIAVAHNQNDNAETLLFHMVRGSSMKGMMGILPVRGSLIRPLLCLSRVEIESYLSLLKQPYKTDHTNEMDIYTRNKIRLHILPKLTEINDQAVFHMMELSNTMQEMYQYIATQAFEKIADETYIREKENGFLLTEDMLQLPQILVDEIIYQILVKLLNSAKNLSKEHVSSIEKLFTKQTGKRIHLPKDFVAIRQYEGIFVTKQMKQQTRKELFDRQENHKEIASAFEKQIVYTLIETKPKMGEIPKNRYTKWFDYDKIKDKLQIRTRKQGDYFVLDDSGCKKSLKKYFIEAKIEKEKRDDIPLLADGEHILWIIGYRISAFYKVSEETKRILEVRFIGGRDNE